MPKYRTSWLCRLLHNARCWTFSIPNVTASDGDPNYMGGFELVENDTINTAIVGSAYNYTYTANPDAAGNLMEIA